MADYQHNDAFETSDANKNSHLDKASQLDEALLTLQGEDSSSILAESNEEESDFLFTEGDEVALEDSDYDELLEKAGRVALAGVAAASLTAALAEPPRTDMMVLPEATPIVQVLSEESEQDPVEDQQDEAEQESRLERILRILRFLVVGLALVGALLFASLKGCAACSAYMASQRGNEVEQQTSDEDSTDDGDTTAEAPQG